MAMLSSLTNLDAAASRQSTSTPPRRRVAPVLAGVGYSLAWIAGLTVASASTDVTSTGAALLADSAGHEVASITQYVLTEGVAAVLLAVVVVLLGRAVGEHRGSRLLTGTGLVAAGISLVQCALGVTLAGWAAPGGHADVAGALFETVNRLDGLKMFVLAAMALAGAGLARRAAILPHWFGYLGLALAVTLVASGVGYLFLMSTAALAAYVSLPLLLVWVTTAGLLVRRTGR
ncbi:hypothetical protein GCM10023176_60340 [Micromonospora coerulea]|uniref:DUF4386 domain-containing protein n=1 Tax=Micromonospora coerulea TaxID=47856 RepID=A0ABP8T5H0_9ACTN